MASIAQAGRIARAGIASPARSPSQQAARQARPSVRTAALKQPPAGVKEEEVQVSAAPASAPASSGKAPPPMINVIPENGVWENGIPPVMGGHLMASGTVTSAMQTPNCAHIQAPFRMVPMVKSIQILCRNFWKKCWKTRSRTRMHPRNHALLHCFSICAFFQALRS